MKNRFFWLSVAAILAFGAPRPAEGQWLRVSGTEGFHCLVARGADLYAGTASTFGGGYVVISENGGVTWRRLDTAGWPKKRKGMPIVFIVNSLAWNGPDLLAATNEGIYITRDNGASWTAGAGFAQDPTVYCLAVGTSRLYAGTQRAVFVSTDGGLNWTPAAGAGLPGSYIQLLTVQGTDLFAGTFNGIWVSKDGGATWTEANNGFPKERNVSCLAASGPYLLAQFGASGFFRSADGGASWTRSDSGLPANAQVSCLAEIGPKLFAGLSKGGIFASSDHGGTWAAMNEGWPRDRVSVNWLAESGGQILAGVFAENVSGYEIWRWSSGPAGGGGETAQTYFDNGQRAFGAGDFANAVLLFGKAIEKDPKSAAARIQRGWAYVRLGGRSSYDSALADADKALELSPADKSVYFLRGEIYRNLAYFALDKKDQPQADGLLAKALADYQVALDANPGSAVIRRSLGHAYFAKGDLDRALEAYSQVLQENPRDSEIEGDLKRLFGAYDRQQREIDAGDHKDTWYLAGAFYSGAHRDALAVKCYTKAIELGRADQFAYWDRARAYTGTGQFVEALADADRMIELSGSYYGYALRAGIYKAKGDLDRALADYAKAIHLASKKTSSYSEAESRARATLDYLSARGDIYAERRAWDKAIAEYKEAGKILTGGPIKAHILSRIGQLYEAKGDAANAQKYRQQAEALDPRLKK